MSAPANGDAGRLGPDYYAGLLKTDPWRYLAMVEAVSEFGICLIDPDGHVQSWNQGAARLTGWGPAEVIGHPYAQLFAASALKNGLPVHALQFARANRHCKEEGERAKASGDSFVSLFTLDAIRDGDGMIVGFVEVVQDITEQKARELALYHGATRDPLTQFFNRGYFVERLDQEILRARRFLDPLSVVLMEIDQHLGLQEERGPDVADQALITVARTAAGFIRKVDLMGRTEPRQLALALPRTRKEGAFEVAQRLRVKLLEESADSNGGTPPFTLSMGVAMLESTTRNLSELLRNADAALHFAKREGGNRTEAWLE